MLLMYLFTSLHILIIGLFMIVNHKLVHKIEIQSILLTEEINTDPWEDKAYKTKAFGKLTDSSILVDILFSIIFLLNFSLVYLGQPTFNEMMGFIIAFSFVFMIALSVVFTLVIWIYLYIKKRIGKYLSHRWYIFVFTKLFVVSISITSTINIIRLLLLQIEQ